jgi:hypothetical protein
MTFDSLQRERIVKKNVQRLKMHETRRERNEW